MKYTNPVIPGMYPDPSVCYADGAYYLVNSTFEYVPGIPLFKSYDLVNWVQIGNCIVRPEEIGLDNCPCSGGIFAPTIRVHEGRFYLITTCFGRQGMRNFFMTASDPAGEWSKPVFIDIEGIDPSIYWEDGLTYIQYTAFGSINQVTIREADGSILEGPKTITTGCGGRDAEGPHIWKRNGYYYLMLAEGGTREGHMVTLMRGESIWGPYEASPYLPVVSNRDYAREPLQCVGHADWIQDEKGNNYLVALATRHVKHKTILGRETVLTPAFWTEDGWLRAQRPYMPVEAETLFEGEQQRNHSFQLDMSKKELPMQLISPRKRYDNLITMKDSSMFITGNEYSLWDEASPMFLALRQSAYDFTMKASLSFHAFREDEEAGIAMYADALHHFSLFLTMRSVSGRKGKEVLVFRKYIDDIVTEKVIVLEKSDSVSLMITADAHKYYFKYSIKDGNIQDAGWTYNKHLSSSCVESPNTGVVGGIYVVGQQAARITEFSYEEHGPV